MTLGALRERRVKDRLAPSVMLWFFPPGHLSYLLSALSSLTRGVNPSSREGESQTGDWMAWNTVTQAQHKAKKQSTGKCLGHRVGKGTHELSLDNFLSFVFLWG